MPENGAMGREMALAAIPRTKKTPRMAGQEKTPRYNPWGL